MGEITSVFLTFLKLPFYASLFSSPFTSQKQALWQTPQKSLVPFLACKCNFPPRQHSLFNELKKQTPKQKQKQQHKTNQSVNAHRREKRKTAMKKKTEVWGRVKMDMVSLELKQTKDNEGEGIVIKQNGVQAVISYKLESERYEYSLE